MEVAVPELDTSVFIIPAHRVKNRQDRLVILNRVAKGVIEELRGKHPTHVFVYRGRPVGSMNNTAWRECQRARGSGSRARS